MHLVYSGRAWHEQLKELLTGMHGHQKKTLADLSCWASARSGSAVMRRVAESLSERGLSEAKMSSIERRLARFIANERIVVPLIWKLFWSRSWCRSVDRSCTLCWTTRLFGTI